MEMTKRGVPGVWTYGFYDGWVPNYMFFIAHSHNAIGRFYEVQSYGPDHVRSAAGRDDDQQGVVPAESAAAVHQVGPAQQHQHPAVGAPVLAAATSRRTRRLFLENYWLKNKRVDRRRARTARSYAWVIPAAQRRKADAADAVNELRRQGLESTRATRAFKAGNVDVAAGDYIVRGDQPYRTLADMYFSVQNYPPQNPRPYDDTGWTFQLMRNVKIATGRPTRRSSTQPMTLVTGRREGGRRHRRHGQRRSSSSTPPTTTW